MPVASIRGVTRRQAVQRWVIRRCSVDKQQFMQGCARGGRALDRAIRELHRTYWSDLLREAYRVLATIDEARDAAQDALIKCWRECRQFRGDGEVLAWLRPIVRRTAIDRLRARHVEVPLVDDANEVLAEVETALRDAAAASGNDPLSAAESAQRERVFLACFARFEADHPEAAFALRWVTEDGLDNDALADHLGRTPHATREFVSQCRKKARVYLAPWYALASRRAASNATNAPARPMGEFGIARVRAGTALGAQLRGAALGREAHHPEGLP